MVATKLTYAGVFLNSSALAFEDLHVDIVLLLLAGGLLGHNRAPSLYRERDGAGRPGRDQADLSVLTKSTIRSQVTITPSYFSCRPLLLLGFVHLELQ